MLRNVPVLRVTGVVIVAGLVAVTVAILGFSRSDGDEPPPDPVAGLIGDGARAVIDADAVVPASRPPYLTLILPVTRVSDDLRTVIGTETSYQAGALDVMVCDSPAAGGSSTGSCTIEERQVLRDETIGDRRVRVAADADWNVPTSEAEVPEGDRIAEILWWWTSVPLVGDTTPAWLTDAAAVPGAGMFRPAGEAEGLHRR